MSNVLPCNNCSLLRNATKPEILYYYIHTGRYFNKKGVTLMCYKNRRRLFCFFSSIALLACSSLVDAARARVEIHDPGRPIGSSTFRHGHERNEMTVHNHSPNAHVNRGGRGKYYYNGKHYNYYHGGRYYNYHHNNKYYVYRHNGRYYNYYYQGQYYKTCVPAGRNSSVMICH